MALTDTQAKRAARRLAKEIFENTNAAANFDLDGLRAAIDSIETAMSATTNQIVAARPGVTLQSALVAHIGDAWAGSSSEQKAIALAIWALEKAGLLGD